MTGEEKVIAWHKGTRGMNLDACSCEKLYDYYIWASKKGYLSEMAQCIKTLNYRYGVFIKPMVLGMDSASSIPFATTSYLGPVKQLMQALRVNAKEYRIGPYSGTFSIPTAIKRVEVYSFINSPSSTFVGFNEIGVFENCKLVYSWKEEPLKAINYLIEKTYEQ